MLDSRPLVEGKLVNRMKSQRHAELVGAALQRIPEPILSRIGFDVAAGVDPGFIGLHAYRAGLDGRRYTDVAHVAFPFHQKRLPACHRSTTIVLPRPEQLRTMTVIHEVGHVLHEHLGFKPTLSPTSPYARTNRFESFAEAFAGWVVGFTDDRWAVGGQPLVGPGRQLLLAHRPAGGQADGGGGHLTQAGVGQADHGGLGHRRVLLQRPLHLYGVDRVAAARA